MESENSAINGPLLILDPGIPLPPYEQIRAQLRMQIAAKRLPAGSLLPSVRQLARDLGVAPNTVVRAYNELEREGLVVASKRRGVMVAQAPPILTEEQREHELELAVARLLVTVHHLGISADDVYTELQRQLGAISVENR